MESPDWTEINAGIQQHLQKAYNTNKAAFKAQHWVIDPTTGTYNVEKIRRARPEDITAEEWDKYIQFWNDPRNIARAAQNRQNRAKSTVISRQGSRSLARLRDEMRQSSATQEYPSLIDTLSSGTHRRDERLELRTTLMTRSIAWLEGFESGGASGSGGCGDDEESADDQEDEDEDGDGDNYPILEVIQNRNGPVSITTDTQGQIKVLPPRTAKEILARERERKARTTLLMALPEDHLAKFHKMTDAKEMWDAIKSRFERLHKGYDRFQSLLSQLEIHGAGVSTEDANQKFLRSLPSTWSQVSLIMRTKPRVESLSFDDLYNNLRVFENDVKGSTASSSSTKNVAFISKNTSSTNDVSTAYSFSNPSGQNSQYKQTSSYSLLANQSSCPQLDREDLEQLD
ncbi:ribonuclease H-like domain-containing protein [Tanacetum coccineum]